MATADYDPHLGEGPSDDSEILSDDSDTDSILSDDSVLPEYGRDDGDKTPAKTLYEACVKNDPAAMRRILERGVTKDEAMELDINGRVRQKLRHKHCPNRGGPGLIHFFLVPPFRTGSCWL